MSKLPPGKPFLDPVGVGMGDCKRAGIFAIWWGGHSTWLTDVASVYIAKSADMNLEKGRLTQSLRKGRCGIDWLQKWWDELGFDGMEFIVLKRPPTDLPRDLLPDWLDASLKEAIEKFSKDFDFVMTNDVQPIATRDGPQAG
jgi:hypothetical protein